MNQQLWLWEVKTASENLHGFVRAIDPRDAVSRALTSQHASGKLLGTALKIPLEVIDAAPANNAASFAYNEAGLSITVSKVTCPTNARTEQDLIGCGSQNVTDPDEEGMVDCHFCGLFFNPLTAR